MCCCEFVPGIRLRIEDANNVDALGTNNVEAFVYLCVVVPACVLTIVSVSFQIDWKIQQLSNCGNPMGTSLVSYVTRVNHTGLRVPFPLFRISCEACHVLLGCH